ncbi:fatty acid binding protein 1-B.1-like [Diabrotica undecimpunctata]|uniref:fatty acid binding protein 1-B.1-like n=1 Tax=Diabrotica undecimpunctata TaxID=50387 RepID=UPI003B635BE9
MSLVTGKYVNVGEEGFKEFMISQGVPENFLQRWKDEKSIEEFKLDGNKLTKSHIVEGAADKTRTTEIILGQEYEEQMGPRKVKNLATLDGNVLIITSLKDDGSTSTTRTHTFSEDGLVIVHKSSKGEGKLMFKRL